MFTTRFAAVSPAPNSLNSLIKIQIIYVLLVSVSGDLSDIAFTQKNNLVTSVSSIPPWHLVTPTVDLSLSILSKSETSPEIYHSKFLEICEGLQDYYHIYTDGSTRQHSYRTVDRAMRPIYGCPEKFSESSLRTGLFFQKFVMDFCSDRC